MNPPEKYSATLTGGHSPPSPGEGSDYAFLAATTRKILEEKDISQVLRTVCEEACRVLGAERSLIVQIQKDDPSQRKILYAHNIPPDFLDTLKASKKNSILREVFLEKRLKVFSDIEKESNAFDPAVLRQMGLRVVCAIPLFVEGNSFGALVLYHLTPKEYTPRDCQLGEAFGDLASIAIEKAHLTQIDQKRTARLEVVDQIAKAITSTIEPKELFRIIGQEIRRVVSCERCRIASLDRPNSTFHTWHRESEIEPDPSRLKNDPEFFNWILQQIYETKRPLNIPDIRELHFPWIASRIKSGIRSYLFIPILLEEVAIAHLSISSTKVGAFTDEDVELLTSIASHLGSAIRNATLYKASKDHALRLEVIGRIAKAAGSSLVPDEIFAIIGREMRRAVPCDRIIIATFDSKSAALQQFFEECDIPIGPPPKSQYKQGTISQALYENKEVINIPDITETLWRNNHIAKEGFHSVVAVPILQEEKCIAHFILSSKEKGAFDKDQETLLIAIADHLGPAIRNATLYRTAQERAERLEIAGEIAKAVGSTLEPKELFATVVREIRKAVPCERCVIGHLDHDANQYRVWHLESDIPFVSRTQLTEGWWDQEVYTKNQIFSVEDTRNLSHPRAQELAESGFLAILVIPILQDGRCIAHLSLLSRSPAAFTAEHKELLTSLSSHLGSAIRNATLHQESQKREIRLELVGKIAKAVGSALDPEELFSTLVREIRNAVPCERCVISTIDKQKNQYLRWHTQSEIKTEERSTEIGPDEWNGEGVYDTNRPLHIKDLSEDRWSVHRRLLNAGFRSLLILPIVQNGRCIAHLNVASTTVSAFSEEDAELLTSIAGHLGPAIRNATLYKAAEERADRFAVLNDLTQKITENLDIDEVLESISDATLELLKGDLVRIRLLDESTGELVVRSISGNNPSSLNQNSLKIEDSIPGQLDEKIKPLIVPDVQEISQWPHLDWALEVGVHSLVISPLKLGSTVIGMISCYSRERDFFSQEHLNLLGAFASQASVSIENARLFQESEEKGKRLATLVGATKHLARDLDLPLVLNSIVEAAASLFKGEAGLRLLEGEELVRVAATPGALGGMNVERIHLEKSFGGEVILEGTPLISSDLNLDPRVKHKYQRPVQISAIMGIPVKRGDHVLGALYVFREKGHKFDEESVSIANSFADQAAVAIENARLHEESRKSLEFFRSVVGGNADAIILQDTDRRIIFWNEGAEKLYGYTEEEALGKNINSLFTDNDKKGAKRGDVIFKEGVSSHFEGMRVKKDGSLVPVSITLSPIKNQDGKVVALTAIHKDLSERNQAEEKFRKSEERTRSIMESAADAIVTIDERGIVESLNPATERLFGYPSGEVIGQNINMLMAEPDKSFHDGYMENYVKTGKAKIIGIGAREVMGRRKNGDSVPLDLAVSETVIGGRRLFIGVLRDITERKLVEEDLRLARDEAEAASRAKSEFLSTMSHELRSPLNAVIGFSDILLRDASESDELTHRLVPKIRDSGKYLLSMIEEMLDLDRIAEGKVRLKLESTSLNDLIFRVVDSWRPRLSDGFSLSLQLDHACGIIGCDVTRFSQILNNLIDNAVKYSPNGGAISIQTTSMPDEIQVSVQDEGMGIGTAAKKIIFDRFRQLESGYTRRAGGLGIGLALARELMEMHGGRIWVESEEGKGSLFTLALPRIQVTNQENPLQTGDAEASADNEDPWDGRTILIVDDVENYHEYLRLLMSSAARLESACDGEKALELAARERPDIILMDLRMPVMDGFEAIEHLKSDPKTKDIPVLAVTAQVMNEDRDRCMQAGADGFVTKPIEAQLLKNEMRRLLSAKV